MHAIMWERMFFTNVGNHFCKTHAVEEVSQHALLVLLIGCGGAICANARRFGNMYHHFADSKLHSKTNFF
jgi:hypothetical protein